MSDRPKVMQVELQEVAEISCLERGDHLAVKDKTLFKTYYHHGICLGKERDFKVADFGSDRKFIVRQIDLLLFKGNRRLFKYMYPPDTCREPAAVACVAEEVVQNPNIWGSYNLLTNNCEHFATRCKVGTAYSIQVAKINKLEKAMAKSANKFLKS